jgi:hypothetical protein
LLFPSTIFQVAMFLNKGALPQQACAGGCLLVFFCFLSPSAFFRVAKFLDKGVLVGGDPFTKEAKYCLKTIENKEECSNVRRS